MKRLSSRGWLVMFLLTLLLLAFLLAAFNFVTDPFGAFGDRFFTWWSYDETNNPRVAKLGYLDRHHGEYDSYILGCSATSSFPTEALNRYFDAKFYNMIVYGADMRDTENFCRYILDNYEAKNIVLNVYLGNGLSYGVEDDPLTLSMPARAEGGSELKYYLRYLFANPKYGAAKLSARRKDTYLQQDFDVFDEKTGAYDKERRDLEHIGGMESYLEAYPVFAQYPWARYDLTETENTMKSVAAIRDMCAEKGVNFVVVTSPLYCDYADYFPREQVEEFYSALAEVTPYWDFSLSSVSRDPRFFYDSTHFRNDAGRMALARMFGDGGVYVPEDFGVYVPRGGGAGHLSAYWDGPEPDRAAYTAKVPIILYHDIDRDETAATMNGPWLRGQLTALKEAGYTSVTFDDLYNYVMYGVELPEKPVVITFDDGYASNYELAWPILKELDMKATIFVIGASVGKDTYKDTGVPMNPHFTVEQAREMMASGLISIKSHGYDLHEVEGRDPDPIRQGILRREDETEEEYIKFLRSDAEKMRALLSEMGTEPRVLALPYGYPSELGEAIMAEEGIRSTLTTEPVTNELIKGLPQCLYDMGRYGITSPISPEELINMIEG